MSLSTSSVGSSSSTSPPARKRSGGRSASSSGGARYGSTQRRGRQSHRRKMSPTPPDPAPPPVPLAASIEMALFCFDVLRSALLLDNRHEAAARRRSPLLLSSAANGLASRFPADPTDRSQPARCPFFVTWTKASVSNPRREPSLRGCIGTFGDQPLPQGLAEYALLAALEDSRFDPIRLKELPRLHCAVSVLSDFEPAASVYDWEVGTHGLRIEFDDGHHRRSATYLPEVAPSQGWSREETVVSLITKSGYRGRVTAKLLRSMTVTRYQVTKARASYADYAAHMAAWSASVESTSSVGSVTSTNTTSTTTSTSPTEASTSATSGDGGGDAGDDDETERSEPKRGVHRRNDGRSRRR